MSFGVDYASVDQNKPPDFRALTAAGASFCWVRGSFAWYDVSHGAWHLQADPVLARDWKNLASAGLVRGAYLFPVLEASQSAAEQVAVLKHAVDAAGGLRPGIDLPPCLDVEFPGRGIAATGKDRAGVMVWIREAVAELRKQFGCRPIIYTSGRVWNDTDADCLGNPPAPDLVDCPLWLARYASAARHAAVVPPPVSAAPPPVPSPWGDQWWAHQYQGDALGCPGFSSTVDLDRFRSARQGDSGGHVAWLQKKLGIVADGSFGPKTDGTVRAFQGHRGLLPDGQVGIRTFAALAWLP